MPYLGSFTVHFKLSIKKSSHRQLSADVFFQGYTVIATLGSLKKVIERNFYRYGSTISQGLLFCRSIFKLVSIGVVLDCTNSRMSNYQKLTETRFTIFALSLLKYSLILSSNRLQHAKNSSDTVSGFLNIMFRSEGGFLGAFSSNCATAYKDSEWASGFEK